MNQDDAAKLLNAIVQHQARIDALNAEIATLKKQNKRLKVRADRQCMAIAELREQWGSSTRYWHLFESKGGKDEKGVFNR